MQIILKSLGEIFLWHEQHFFSLFLNSNIYLHYLVPIVLASVKCIVAFYLN